MSSNITKYLTARGMYNIYNTASHNVSEYINSNFPSEIDWEYVKKPKYFDENYYINPEDFSGQLKNIYINIGPDHYVKNLTDDKQRFYDGIYYESYYDDSNATKIGSLEIQDDDIYSKSYDIYSPSTSASNISVGINAFKYTVSGNDVLSFFNITTSENQKVGIYFQDTQLNGCLNYLKANDEVYFTTEICDQLTFCVNNATNKRLGVVKLKTHQDISSYESFDTYIEDQKLYVTIPYASSSGFGVLKPYSDLTEEPKTADDYKGGYFKGYVDSEHRLFFYPEVSQHTYTEEKIPKLSGGYLYWDKSSLSWKNITRNHWDAKGNSYPYCNGSNISEKKIEVVSEFEDPSDASSDTIYYLASADNGCSTIYYYSSIFFKKSYFYCTMAYETSDRRLKEDIKDIEKDCDIEFKQFKFKDDDRLHYGVIAQDIEEEYPELVNNDGEYKTVNYNDLLILKINSLEKRLAELEKLL